MASSFIFEVCDIEQAKSYKSKLCESTYFNTNYNFFDYTQDLDEVKVKNAITEFMEDVIEPSMILHNEDDLTPSFVITDENAKDFFKDKYERFMKNVSDLSLDEFSGNACVENKAKLRNVTRELTETFEAVHIYYDGGTYDLDTFVRENRGKFSVVHALKYHC